MTDLTGSPPDLLGSLPDDPAELMRIVRGCVISAGMLSRLYGLSPPEGREGESQTRPAAAMLGRILELDSSPLEMPRPPERRFLGNCRHFATLGCALLRRKGIPARVRAGFAAYFEPGTRTDHWGHRRLVANVGLSPVWVFVRWAAAVAVIVGRFRA